MECSGIPVITLGELGDALLLSLKGRRFPLGATFELTERCNLRCLHCYINQPAGCREAASRELTLPQVKQVLDKIAAAGCLFVTFTGGEPLLRPDFPEIWRYAKGKGLLVSLFTNGTLLTPQIADLLAEYRPVAIEITLYGATAETYERVTGVPGSYARCLAGIERVVERGLRLNLKSVVLQANRHELDAMAALADRFGASYRFDGVLWAWSDGDPAPYPQRLSVAEVVALDREYPERQREYERLVRTCGAAATRNDKVYACGAGRRTLHLDSAGRLSACMMARRPSYDLLQGSFEEGWEQFLGGVLARERTKETPCRTCPVSALCAQCPGWSQMVHGDDETIVDYVCEITRLRGAQMGLTEPPAAMAAPEAAASAETMGALAAE